MSFLKNSEVKLLILIHGWGTIILGLFLIFTLGTGTLSVFSWQLGEWNAAANELKSPLAPPIDATVQRLLRGFPREARSEIDLSKTVADAVRVEVRGRVNGKSSETLFELNPDGSVFRTTVDPERGYPGDVEYGNKRTFLRRFLVNLHTRYGTRGRSAWSILIVALVGTMFCSAMVSGLIIHWKNIIPDIFTLRKNAHPKVSNKDAHTVVGSWLLPFGFIWSFSGAFFGYYTFILFLFIPAGGPKLPPTPPVDPALLRLAPGPRANLDTVLADVLRRTGKEPLEVTILDHPGQPSRIHVHHIYDERAAKLQDTFFLYDGADGHLITQTSSVPSSVKEKMYAWLMSLHFGYFGGLFSKVAVGLMGFGLSRLTFSGIKLWVAAREEKEPGWIIFERAATVVAVGQILAFATAAAGSFLSLPNRDVDAWTTWGFIAGAIVAVAAGVFVPRRSLSNFLRSLAGVALLTLPLLRIHAGGPGWSDALATHRQMVVIFDVALIVIALLLLFRPLRSFISEIGMFRPRPDNLGAAA